MTWFDTHCHVADADFDPDRRDVLARAWAAGLTGIVAVGSDGAGSRRAVALSKEDGRVRAAAGVHPHRAATSEGDLEEIARILREGDAVAVGEIGLDYHYDFAPRAAQLRVLELQLDLARRHRLPVILHVREAEDDMLALLREALLPAGGVWHCFTASAGVADAAMASGLHLGIGGIVTFPNAGTVAEVARAAPLDRLVLETDSPYLAPVPFRGRRNEPSHVAVIGRRLAELRRAPEEVVAQATTANAERLFGCGTGDAP